MPDNDIAMAAEIEAADDERGDWDDWERPAPAFCDNYDIHDQHAYQAINHETYLCPGFTQADADTMDEIDSQPPCEHGMAAILCAGPGHYPQDTGW